MIPKYINHRKISAQTVPRTWSKHDKSLVLAKATLEKEFKGNEVQFLIVKPLPDMIMVDFEKKEIFAVEISKKEQKSPKIRNYAVSDFDSLLFVQNTEKLNRKIKKIEAFYFEKSPHLRLVSN